MKIDKTRKNNPRKSVCICTHKELFNLLCLVSWRIRIPKRCKPTSQLRILNDLVLLLCPNLSKRWEKQRNKHKGP